MINKQIQKELPPHVAMLQFLGGIRVARSLYVAAKLGIADLLIDSPKTSTELATATNTDSSSLYRVLRALAGFGFFAEDEESRFCLTPPAEFLRTDVPDSVTNNIKVLGDDWHWQLWGDLEESVRTGKPAFDRLYGSNFFDFCQQNPDFAKINPPSKTSISARAASSLVDNYDFSQFNKVVECAIVGSCGNGIISILKANPQVEGILFDISSVMEVAEPVVKNSGVADRLKLIAGDCREYIPEGGDVYILMFVLHNWDDDRAIKILQNCRQAMTENSVLLIVEMIMPSGNQPFVGKLIDLESLLTTPGGYERNESEYRAILNSAGFEVRKIIPSQTANSIIEAVVGD
jgi:hypothetical protein